MNKLFTPQSIKIFARDMLITGAVVYLTYDNVFFFTTCIGPSMEPTFDKRGELAFVNVISYKYLGAEYQKGDVVISATPENENRSKSFSIFKENDSLINKSKIL
jgi:signal peptidase I